MRIASRLLAAVLGAALLVAAPTASAQDRAEPIDDRVAALRQLSREDKLRLKQALARFKSMTPDEKERLRERARALGPDRLRELARRDVQKLRRQHDALDRERTAIVELLGRERLARLSEPERRYVKALTVRSFQRHVKRRLMNIAGPKMFEEFMRLPPHERARRGRNALGRKLEQLFQELPAERQAEIRAMSPRERKRARQELIVEFRMRETIEFARTFDALTLTPFLRKPPEVRAEIARRFAEKERWYEMKRVLERELGIPRDTIRLLRGMRADEWARIRDVYERTADLPRDQRRLQLEEEIRSVYGKGALDDRRGPRRPPRDVRRRRDD